MNDSSGRSVDVPHHRIRAFEAGYQAHIIKPLNPTAVIAAVAALILRA